ncbi:hypothetical protein [Vulcanisaeta sp. JCM 14467]|uniref:hypothetical protein n=1 Tax=Vulcanisaeta sp. JCM 14467 TaxID=1295370 RepID=UPI000AD6C79A|nr:hypothetical protein [Vulcanisaeta sp. JCM 14467]
MSEQELTERLINGIITRLQNEINEWSNNVRLRLRPSSLTVLRQSSISTRAPLRMLIRS